MSRWVKIIFFVSLALNFAVIGVVASKKLGFHKWRHWGMQHHVLKAIPEAKRAKVKKILEEYRKTNPRKRGRMIKNWEQFEKLLLEEKFDREKFIETFNQELLKHNERWTNGGKVIADIAELLTVNERKEVLKKFVKRMKWRHKHHHPHHNNR